MDDRKASGLYRKLLLKIKEEIELAASDGEPLGMDDCWMAILLIERILRDANADFGMSEDLQVKQIRQAKEMGKTLFQEIRDEIRQLRPLMMLDTEDGDMVLREAMLSGSWVMPKDDTPC